MRQPVFPILAALAFLMMLVCVPCALAKGEAEPWVDGVMLKRNGDKLVVDFEVRGVADQQLVDTIDSGLPVRFIYTARLVRKASLLMGGDLAYVQFERVLEKDNLKNHYTIAQDSRQVVVPEFVEAIELMSHVENLELAPFSDLLKGERYRVELQVKLEEFRLPFHLHKILPFVSLWDVTTPLLIQNVPKDFSGQP